MSPPFFTRSETFYLFILMLTSSFGMHVVGILLATLAFGQLGRGIVRRSKAKSFNPLPAFLLMLLAIAFQLFYPEPRLFYRFAHLFLNLGAGMAIAAIYLYVNRERHKMFLVPGILGMLIGGGVYAITGMVYSYCEKDVAGDPGTVELLVELGEDDQLKEIRSILNKYDAQAEKAFPNVDMSESVDLAQYYLVYVDSNLREALIMELDADDENVDQVAPNRPVSIIQPTKGANAPQKGTFLANDPYLSNQWYANKLNYNAVYQWLQANKPKKKAKVAIVDTGVDAEHEDIGNVYTRSGGSGDYDKHSHGTHCAGLAGAATNNGKGIGSLNLNGEYVTLIGFPALDDQGRGTDQRVAKAIIDAAESGADVISMSLGGPSLFGPPKSQVDAIKYARKLGAIVIVAAGNSNDDARRYSPANINGVITVAAVDEQFRKASFSNTNTRLKMPIAAPGVNILSSVPASQYQSYNGTSMATPIVAGLVGMMRAYNPDLTTEQAYRILNNTGTQVSDSPKVGKVINPKKALEAAVSLN